MCFIIDGVICTKLVSYIPWSSRPMNQIYNNNMIEIWDILSLFIYHSTLTSKSSFFFSKINMIKWTNHGPYLLGLVVKPLFNSKSLLRYTWLRSCSQRATRCLHMIQRETHLHWACVYLVHIVSILRMLFTDLQNVFLPLCLQQLGRSYTLLYIMWNSGWFFIYISYL